MKPQRLKAVIAQVQQRFPEFAGCQPKVRLQEAPQPKSASSRPTYLLTFQRTTNLHTITGSKALLRWVRVVVDEDGKILKITTSR
jgi:hypothetical protein